MNTFTGSDISRRGFVTGALAVAGLAIAGCGGGSGGGGGGGTLKTALNVAVPSDISLPTLLRFQAANQALRRTVFNYVLDKNTDGTYRPALAKSWETSSDGKKLVIKLRDDVKYHSGRSFGPDDVIAAVAAATATGSGSQVGTILKRATGLTKSGSSELTATFDAPFPSYLDGLSALPIIDASTFADLPTGKQVIGTGPFKWSSWTPGNTLELVKNPDYFGGAPSFDTVSFRVIADSQALLAALRSGSADMAIRMLARDAATLKKDSKFTVTTGRGFEIYVGVNTSVKPLNDPKVRQAIAYSIDRKRIADQVFGGTADPSCVPWGKDTPGVSSAQDTKYTYDIAKAKALLAAAGATGVEITISSNPAEPTYVATQDIVQYGLEQAGFKVRNVAVDSGGLRVQDSGRRLRRHLGGRRGVDRSGRNDCAAHRQPAHHGEEHLQFRQPRIHQSRQRGDQRERIGTGRCNDGANRLHARPGISQHCGAGPHAPCRGQGPHRRVP